MCAGLALTLIGVPFPIDYGEGPLLDQVARLANFENIYRPSFSLPPYTVSNYPPLFHMAALPLVWVFGPAFWEIRLVALVATFAAAVFCGLIVRHLGCSPKAGLMAAGLFLANPFVMSWALYGRVDSLALALSLAAMWTVVRRAESKSAMMLAGALLALAVLSRQDHILAGPAAICCYLWAKGKPKNAAVCLLSFFLLCGAVVMLLNAASGGGFFLNTVQANLNEIRWGRLRDSVELIALTLPVLLALALASSCQGSNSRPHGRGLLFPYLVLSFVSFVLVAKVGASTNYFWELCAALAMLGAVFWGCERNNKWQSALVSLGLAFQIAFMIIQGWAFSKAAFLAVRTYADGLKQVVTLISATSSPILASDFVGIEVPLGRRIYFQPFEMTQLSKAKLWDERPFVNEIEKQNFGVIITSDKASSGPGERWTPEMWAAINGAYQDSFRMGRIRVMLPSSLPPKQSAQ